MFGLKLRESDRRAGKKSKSRHLKQLAGIELPIFEVGFSAASAGGFKDLAEAVRRKGLGTRGYSITVTGLVAEKSKSTAANLAAVLAQDSARVILVDANLQRTSIGGSEASGFVEMLINRRRTPVGLYEAENGVMVLPAGTAPSLPDTGLLLPQLPLVIGRLEEITDYVIFDAPLVSDRPDLMRLVAHSDHTLLVLEAKRLKKSDVAQAVDNLKSAGGLIIVVLGKAGASASVETTSPSIAPPESPIPASPVVPANALSPGNLRLTIYPVSDFDTVLQFDDLLNSLPNVRNVMLADLHENEKEAVFRIRHDGRLSLEEIMSRIVEGTGQDIRLVERLPEAITLRTVNQG
jgi:Mrp family chromosome partitioning ATPase